MQSSVITNNRHAYEVLVEYCDENKLDYSTIEFDEQLVVAIDNPSDKVISDITRFIRALSMIVDIKHKLHEDTQNLDI